MQLDISEHGDKACETIVMCSGVGKAQVANDIYSDEKRSWLMSKVRTKDTRPEIAVHDLLDAFGYRFRLHIPELPGTPDIVLPEQGVVIFVHGCFWHLHPGCRKSKLPKTRAEWWRSKLERNAERDEQQQTSLLSQGWAVVVVWECQTSNPQMLANAVLPFLSREGIGESK